jgi:hypothetical protein
MLLYAAMLLAQDAPAPCAAMDAALPAPLSAWTLVPGGELAVGKAIMRPTLAATMLPSLPAGAKPGRVMTAGFTVDIAGTYGIALDQAGWIELVPGGQTAALASIGHGHGPACSTIRKIVRYRLEPGFYRVTVTGLKVAMAKLMLVEDDRPPLALAM